MMLSCIDDKFQFCPLTLKNFNYVSILLKVYFYPSTIEIELKEQLH